MKQRKKIPDGKKVLLVEAEKAVLNPLKNFLKAHGLDVTSFCDGLDAAQCFVQVRHDLVVTDINTPGISGIILADYVKSQDSNIPVFAITGHKINISGLFDEVISKPVDLNVVLSLIHYYFVEVCWEEAFERG